MILFFLFFLCNPWGLQLALHFEASNNKYMLALMCHRSDNEWTDLWVGCMFHNPHRWVECNPYLRDSVFISFQAKTKTRTSTIHMLPIYRVSSKARCEKIKKFPGDPLKLGHIRKNKIGASQSAPDYPTTPEFHIGDHREGNGYIHWIEYGVECAKWA